MCETTCKAKSTLIPLLHLPKTVASVSNRNRYTASVATLTKKPYAIPIWLPLLLCLALVVADQSLKAWALGALNQGEAAKPFIPGLIEWQLTFNTGAAWSMFSGSAKILAVLRIVIGIAMLIFLIVRPQTRFLTIILSMIAAGAIGNAIDGFTESRGVIDMIHSPLFSQVTQAINGSNFPIFNIADSCVVVGVLLWMIYSFIPEKKPRPQELNQPLKTEQKQS